MFVVYCVLYLLNSTKSTQCYRCFYQNWTFTFRFQTDADLQVSTWLILLAVIPVVCVVIVIAFCVVK